MAYDYGDDEREMWVSNDLSLYLAWQNSGIPIEDYVRDNRTQLDEYIDRHIR